MLDKLDAGLLRGTIGRRKFIQWSLALGVSLKTAVALANTLDAARANQDERAAKLPADLPMHPQAKLQEAAGHDGACKARVASFAVAGDRAAVLDWYRTRAQAGGYETEREDKNGDWVLAGTRKDVIFVITIGTPARGATPVDYVWTEGA